MNVGPTTQPPRYRLAKVREVIEVLTCEGAGVESDPARIVTRYVDPETGETLATNDPCARASGAGGGDE